MSNINTMNQLPFDTTTWTHGFWKTKEDLCVQNTLNSVYEALNNPENSAVFTNFYIMAGLQEGEYAGSTYWGDGDCYKWIEAASYIYFKNKDEALKAKMDKEIEVIEKAQCEDGYIHAYIQLTNQERLKTRMYHEDYNFGHLFTAGAVNYSLTGDTKLLNVAIKAADYLYREYTKTPVQYPHFGWNPSHIMGLVDLYRVTKNKNYLELAEIFVTLKGSDNNLATQAFDYDENGMFTRGGGDQNQDRTPLREENVPIGHAVTATYLYAGAADVCLEQNEPELLAALERISKHLYDKRVYITGGVGAQHLGFSENDNPVHEAFDRDYRLPLSTAYNETCANVGSAMWHWRMFLLTKNPKYMDIVENVMYNSGISGMSADGMKFRYTNPMKWYGKEQELLSNDTYERWFTHSCYCCPPQMARTMSSMNQYVCTADENSLYFNLYGGCDIKTTVNDQQIDITEKTYYPWEGTVTITINRPITGISLKFRIPEYSQNSSVSLNGETVLCKAGTYCEINQDLDAGDEIIIELDMSIRKMNSNPKVEASKNQFAFMRGPVVFCVESPEIDYADIDSIYIDPKDEFTPVFETDLFYGVTTLEGPGYILLNSGDNLYQSWHEDEYKNINLKLIPYYTWNNRGNNQMSVWLPRI